MWRLAVLAACAEAASIAQRSICPWGGRCEDDESAVMNLLQVHAEREAGGSASDRTARSAMRHRRARDTSNATAKIKSTHPFYHTTSEIHHKIRHLAKNCGGAMTIETLSDPGPVSVNIDLVRIRAPETNPANRVFILFGEHSRELISPESGLRFLEVLCGKKDIDSDVKVSSVLQDNEFHLVINGNPHSRTKVEDGEYCLRTNPNGVDLNRNWDEKWVKQDAEFSDTYSGTRPFSEPETRIFKKLVEQFKPTTFLTVHSGTKGLYMPWAYDMQHTANYNAPLMLQVLKDLDRKHCQCPYGAAGREVGYSCPGTCLDWVYSKLRTPYVFAFEIYTSPDRDMDLKQRWEEKMKSGGLQLLQSGSHLGHEHFAELFADFASDFVQRSSDGEAVERANDDCFDMFNPNTKELYDQTVQNWAVAYLEMASRISTDLKDGAFDAANSTSPM